jgi:hypothetical protein
MRSGNVPKYGTINCKVFFPRGFTCPLLFGWCEYSHLIFLKLRKKELLAKLSKFTK